MTRSRILSMLVTAILAAACGAAPSTTTGTDTSKPFIFGVVMPLSGAYAVIGAEAMQGIQAAIDEVNNTGGILGRHVTLVTRDSQTDTNKSVLATRDMLDNVKPDFLLPDTAQQFVEANLTITTPVKQVTMEAASGASLGDPSKYPYNFQLSVLKQQETAAMGAGLAYLKGITKVGVISSTDVPGKDMTAAAQQQYPKLGMQVVANEYMSLTATDVTVQLQKLRSAGPQALIIHAPGNLASVLNGVRDIGWTDVILMGDSGFITTDLVAAAPQSVRSQLYFPALKGVTREGDTIDSPFIRDLLRYGKIQALYVSSLDADIVHFVRWAYNKAGSTDPDKVKAAFETLSKASDKDLPQDLVLVGNPGYSSTLHNLTNADLSRSWALCKFSPLVNGTYQRVTVLSVPRIAS